MRIFSTFTGIGGFEIGIQSAFESHTKTQQANADSGHSTDNSSHPLQEWGQSATCVGYSEIDKYASSVYERHFPNVKNYGDITKINADELPDFDCLVGGFPCQAFSIAGKRRGFEDTRGTLFFDLARILKAKTPRLFVFENVKGLLSHDNGNTFKTIIAAIDELGYDCQWQVLNSKNHGVPQNRERIIIVGHLRGTSRPEVFPIGGYSGEDIEIREGATEIAPTITANYSKNQSDAPYVVERSVNQVGQLYDNGHNSRAGRIYSDDGISPSVSATDGGGNQPMILVPEATKKGYAEATVGQAINLNQPNSKTRRGRVSDISPTIDTKMDIHTLTEDIQIRRLTPIECERLQAFPDDWTKYGVRQQPDGYICEKCSGANNEGHGAYCRFNYVEISDTQRYKMCGNAVTTNVIRDVFIKIMETAE